MQLLRDYALSFVGVPYKWNGKNPVEGLDCSGLVQLILRSVGLLEGPFLSAQQIHDRGLLLEEIDKPELGALAFFGESMSQITHVAFCLDGVRMIESRGGDHTTLTREDAAAKGAFVEVRPVKHRKDLVAILKPNYQEVGIA